MQNDLFIVDDERGETLDATGDGCFSVWLSRAEAQDALDSAQASVSPADCAYSVVRFVRQVEKENADDKD